MERKGVGMVILVVMVVTMMCMQMEEGGMVAANCDSVVAEVKDLCRDYVVGEAPPSPGLNSPCCKSLRRNRALLSCLCGRVNFAALNQRNLAFTTSICLIEPLKCP